MMSKVVTQWLAFYICSLNAGYTMIAYRAATADDAEPIAQLHSLSWQQNYRGIWRDEFLNGPVVENRQALWQERLTQPASNQYVVVAMSGEVICGFACAYAHEDATWGTLLDNLHVHQNQKGHGIGTALMQLTARWAQRQAPKAGLYLWVLTQNIKARKFYDHLGGINQERMALENPDGSFSDCYRYVWTDTQKLL